MTSLPDTNILLNAVNADSLHHEACATWLEEQVAKERAMGFAWTVLLGFLRISTHPRVLPNPLSASEAIQYVDEWLALPNARILHAGSKYWDEFRRLLTISGTAGNLVMDLHLAALAKEHEAEICSCDAHFGSFPGVLWFNPTADRRTN